MPGIVYIVDQIDSIKVTKTIFPSPIMRHTEKNRGILVDSPKLFESKLLNNLMKITVPANDGKTFKIPFESALQVFEKTCEEY